MVKTASGSLVHSGPPLEEVDLRLSLSTGHRHDFHGLLTGPPVVVQEGWHYHRVGPLFTLHTENQEGHSHALVIPD